MLPSMVAIFGSLKIVQHLQRHLFWPSMTHQVEQVIYACALWRWHKRTNHKFSLHQSLPLPSCPWDSLSMDFLSVLPMTLCKFDAIWGIVFHFSNMAIFIPCTNTTIAAQNDTLFYHHVWPHFGLPTSIIYDHDKNIVGFTRLSTQIFYFLPSSNGWPNWGVGVTSHTHMIYFSQG